MHKCAVLLGVSLFLVSIQNSNLLQPRRKSRLFPKLLFNVSVCDISYYPECQLYSGCFLCNFAVVYNKIINISQYLGRSGMNQSST